MEGVPKAYESYKHMAPFNAKSWYSLMKNVEPSKARISMFVVVLVILGSYGFAFYNGPQQGRSAQRPNVENVEQNLLAQARIEHIAGNTAKARRLYLEVIGIETNEVRSSHFVLISALYGLIKLSLEQNDKATVRLVFIELKKVINAYPSMSDEALFALNRMDDIREEAGRHDMHDFAFTVATQQRNSIVRLLGPEHPASLAAIELYNQGVQVSDTAE